MSLANAPDLASRLGPFETPLETAKRQEAEAAEAQADVAAAIFSDALALATRCAGVEAFRLLDDQTKRQVRLLGEEIEKRVNPPANAEAQT